MCLITTSYPCPEPDVDDLLHRLVNTRKIVPCGTLKSNDGRIEPCAGGIQVQHQLLGQFESCSWCSSTAQSEYSNNTDGPPLKRKARSDAVVDEESQEAGEERMAKKAKQGDSAGPCETELVSPVSEAMETDGQVLAEPGDEVDQDISVDMPGEVLALLGSREAPALERHFTKGLLFAKMKKSRAAGAIEAAVDRPEEVFGAAEATQERTSKAPGAEQSGTSNLEQVQLLIMKMDQKRVKAEKDREEITERNAILGTQNSQQQQEIVRLRTFSTQQSLEHQNEIKKEKEKAQKRDAENDFLDSEKHILEEKVRMLMQRNDELDKAASHARQSANASVRGKEDQIAELERQIAIMKQVQEIQRRELEDARAHNGILQTQMTGVRTMADGMEGENARLKQQLAATEKENAQLQAVAVQGVLRSSPLAKQEPTAKDEPVVKREVEEQVGG